MKVLNRSGMNLSLAYWDADIVRRRERAWQIYHKVALNSKSIMKNFIGEHYIGVLSNIRNQLQSCRRVCLKFDIAVIDLSLV